MMHPDTEIRFVNDQIGYGVVAKKLIKKGTVTWVQDELDRVFTPPEVEQMQPVAQQMIDKYSFRNKEGNFVLCWDLSKYVNHSFKANCLSTAYDFEIAIRDIFPGEELTNDYGYLNVTEAFEAQNEGTDRKTVYPDDLLNFHQEWDEKIEEAIAQFHKVPQPLHKLIPEKVQQKLDLILQGKERMDSILNLYCGERI